jgi:putative transposase
MGTLRVQGAGHERLEYRMLEGSCDSGEVLLYLDALAHEAQQAGKPSVVVLYNAPFHTAGVVQGVWRRLKGFLMPRRFYDSVAELRQAVVHALRLLGAVEIQCSLGDS